jgi:hypothetical protein
LARVVGMFEKCQEKTFRVHLEIHFGHFHYAVFASD